MEKTKAISAEDIRKYRNSMKKLGLWDENYTALDADIPSKLNLILEMDRVHDVIGASLEQIKLASRLIVFSELDGGLTIENLEALLRPMDALKDIKNSPYFLRNGIKEYVEDIIGLPFMIMDRSDDIKEFDDMMRAIIAQGADLAKLLSRDASVVALLLRKYPEASDYLPPLIDSLKQILNEEDVAKVDKFIGEIDISTVFGQSCYFTAAFAAALTHMNLGGYVTFEDMRGFYDKLDEAYSRSVALKRFINSDDFEVFITAVGKYSER